MPVPLTPPTADSPCPCGSGKPFSACCGPILGGAAPETAEALMRARFTAHIAHDWAFLNRTYLPTAHEDMPTEEPSGAAIGWTRLAVHSHEPGPTPDVAYVEFSAYYLHQGTELSLDERAEFKRHDGRWIYTRPLRQGRAPIRAAAKPGRNDPCPCGSGKKYKHCCMP